MTRAGVEKISVPNLFKINSGKIFDASVAKARGRP